MFREKRTERLWKDGGLLSRPCLLHRLDKDTSGVVAIARTKRSCRHIIRQFEEHTIVKRYLAVVGVPSEACYRGAPCGREVWGTSYPISSLAPPDWARPRTTFLVTKQQGENEETQLDIPFALSSLCGVELVLDGPLQRDPDDRRRCIVGPDGQEAVTILKVQAVQGEFA